MNLPSRRRWRVAGTSVCFALAALPFACKKNEAIGFQIEIPADVAGNVTWIEVGVFDGSCSALRPILAGGVPPDGYVKRLAWQNGGPVPSLGDIARAKYAIGVAARAADCTVLASGCSDVDFKQTSTIDVPLADVGSPGGACTNGAVCQGGRCTPGTDNSNPTVGAGCSLTLLGAGPFADPLVASGGVASAPAVVATDTGFLVAYREYDPFSGSARVTAVPIDQGGGALPAQQTLQPACIANEEDDAAGLAFVGSSGVVTLARAQCNGVGGIDTLPVDGTGTFGNAAFASRPGPVRLSTSHAVAASSAGTFTAFVESGLAQVATSNGIDLGAPTPFGGRGPFTDAWVAASDRAVALLAAGVSSASAATPLDDAGTGDDGGVDSSGPPGLLGNTLFLNMIPAGASLTSLGAPIAFSGTWASLSAQSGRVVVASDSDIPGQPVVYRAFDLGGGLAAVSDGFSTVGTGKVLYADVAFHQDHLFFAVERAGSISLVAYDHATTSPTFLREIPLGDDPRVPSIADVRDGRVAVTATDTRVLVAWTTGASLTSNDSVGAYALFACTTP